VKGNEVVEHRISWLTRVIQLLLKMVPQQRGRTLQEATEPYIIDEHIEIVDV
jgi:hypothetical protein